MFLFFLKRPLSRQNEFGSLPTEFELLMGTMTEITKADYHPVSTHKRSGG
jgi:hypothetical protein